MVQQHQRREPQIRLISQILRESYTGSAPTLLCHTDCFVPTVSFCACSNLCNRCNLRFRSFPEPRLWVVNLLVTHKYGLEANGEGEELKDSSTRAFKKKPSANAGFFIAAFLSP
jgi:hypothetical protein